VHPDRLFGYAGTGVVAVRGTPHDGWARFFTHACKSPIYGGDSYGVPLLFQGWGGTFGMGLLSTAAGNAGRVEHVMGTSFMLPQPARSAEPRPERGTGFGFGYRGGIGAVLDSAGWVYNQFCLEDEDLALDDTWRYLCNRQDGEPVFVGGQAAQFALGLLVNRQTDETTSVPTTDFHYCGMFQTRCWGGYDTFDSVVWPIGGPQNGLLRFVGGAGLFLDQGGGTSYRGGSFGIGDNLVALVRTQSVIGRTGLFADCDSVCDPSYFDAEGVAQ
jgi:hypothetical protein